MPMARPQRSSANADDSSSTSIKVAIQP
jgi:hypothetical protein